jgi:uncharacterized alkaline shock family protein YloU
MHTLHVHSSRGEDQAHQQGEPIVTESLGAVRIARSVLITIVINAALQTTGVVRMARAGSARTRLIGKEIPRSGVALSIKDGMASVDLYIVVESGINIVEVGAAVQEEVASAIEEMIGMQVREVNVYIQDVA